MMTKLGRRLGTSWLARLLRGRRLDRNPLRRGSDRAETVVLGGLLAAFLVAAPFTAHAAGSWDADWLANGPRRSRGVRACSLVTEVPRGGDVWP